MAKVAFLSMDDMTGYVSDDSLSIPHLAAMGVSVEEVPWRSDLDWSRFDLAVIRTTWDYQKQLDGFLAAIARIESQTRLLNASSVAAWNSDKRYLRSFEAKGVRIVPTIWPTNLAACDDLFEFGDQVVVKPTVSASAEGTFRLKSGDNLSAVWAEFASRPAMIQPFLPSIISEGEYSLFYFNGAFSHAIIKVPKSGDFRVQEEHGGDIQPFALTPELSAVGQQIMAAVSEDLLYARVDLVRLPDGELALIELELIEPALYLRTDPEAPARFARAIRERLG